MIVYTTNYSINYITLELVIVYSIIRMSPLLEWSSAEALAAAACWRVELGCLDLCAAKLAGGLTY